MTKGKINLRDELRAHKFEFDLLQKIPCTKQENKEYQKLLKDGGTLPEGVYAYVYDNGETSTRMRTSLLKSSMSSKDLSMRVDSLNSNSYAIR